MASKILLYLGVTPVVIATIEGVLFLLAGVSRPLQGSSPTLPIAASGILFVFSLFITPLLLAAYFADGLTRTNSIWIYVLVAASYSISFAAFLLTADHVPDYAIFFWFAVPTIATMIGGSAIGRADRTTSSACKSGFRAEKI